MTHTRIFGSAALVVTALTIASCGASSTASAPTGATSGDGAATAAPGAGAKAPGTIDPCVLVTQAEASTALGTAASRENKQVPGCDYRAPTGEAVGVVVVRGITKAVFDSSRAKFSSEDGYQDIAGVGESALMVSGTGGGQFECFKSSMAVYATMSLGRDGEVGEALRTLGKTACGRL